MQTRFQRPLLKLPAVVVLQNKPGCHPFRLPPETFPSTARPPASLTRFSSVYLMDCVWRRIKPTVRKR